MEIVVICCFCVLFLCVLSWLKNFQHMKEHAETTNHDIHPKDAELLEQNVNNKAKRLFSEAMHSEKDANAVNEHIPFPTAYRPLLDCMA